MRHAQKVGGFAAPLAAAVCLVVVLAGALGAQTVQVNPAPSTPFHFSFPAGSVSITLGVEVRDVTADDVQRNKLTAEVGAFVMVVRRDGPGYNAGLRRGDVIVQFDGERVRSAAELERLVNETPAGRRVRISAFRGNRLLELDAKLDSNPGGPTSRFFLVPPNVQPNQPWRVFPPPESGGTPNLRPFDDWRGYYYYFGPNQRTPYVPRGPKLVVPGPWLGISVQELTPQLGQYFGTNQGVLIASVEDGSAAAFAGLKAGDIITSVDGRPVTQPDEVSSAIRAKYSGDKVTLQIVRDGRKRTVTATLE